MIDRPHPSPWTTAQVRLVAASDLVAAAVVGIAARAAGDEGSLQDQVAWVNVAVLGLLLVVVANGTLFLVARRAVGRRRLFLVPDAVAQLAPSRRAAVDGRWWWLPGTARAHVSGCPMIAGKPAEEVAAEHIRANRLTRCEICG